MFSRDAEPKEVTIYYRIHLNNDQSKLSRRRTRSPIHHLRARCPCTHAAAPPRPRPPHHRLHVLFVFRGRISINLRSSAGRSICPLLNRIVYVHLLSATARMTPPPGLITVSPLLVILIGLRGIRRFAAVFFRSALLSPRDEN